MEHEKEIYSAVGLIEYIQKVGFLSLLPCVAPGFSAEEVVSDDCGYVVFPDGGWDWPLWKWKGPVVTEGNCMYGKFFASKAGFVSKDWWADFCNYRRSRYPLPAEGSVEEAILSTLKMKGSLITRELRKECGFGGTKLRSKFDAYITRLQMGCYIVTEDFVYPHDKHGQPYGWGWSLLTTPENLVGLEGCSTQLTPAESHRRLLEHFRSILPHATEQQLCKLIG